ncbi:MAG: HAD-IIIC family phosphatase [Candidatus Nealsonbacteria bacterium]|nr:HAD-IIIC family phosphatase [Candidatus Nealsonbacteria bacterium]
MNRPAADAAEPLRVYLACGFTPLHVATLLGAQLRQRLDDDRSVDVQTGLFGDLRGNLHRAIEASPDAVALMIEWADLDPRLGYRSSHGWRPGQQTDIAKTVGSRLAKLRESVEAAAQRTVVAVALPTLPLPPCFQPPLARADATAFVLREMTAQFAASLAAGGSVRVLDPQRLDQLSPHGDRLDLSLLLRSGFPYRLEHASVLGWLLAELIRPATAMKGIITDLDDTLWRGVLGEDGIDGISWDLDHQSHAHALYQEMLASLAESGVLIGVASKNDPHRVAEALRRDDLVIAADRLFPIEAHWGPKSQSVGNILRAWNVGPESVAVIDDSPMELAEIGAAFPQIKCLAFPTRDDPAVLDLLAALRDLFGKPSISQEDRLRASSIRTAHDRSVAAPTTDPDEFLAEANARITLSYDDSGRRAFELINKTNQFNLNGRRIDEPHWRRHRRDVGRFLLSVSYRDKFGPLGKISVVSGRLEERELLIDVWVMSCRAFSRRIEHQVLKGLFDRFDVDAMRLDFAATDRNAPLQEFLRSVTGRDPAVAARISREEFLARCPHVFAQISTQ